MKAGVLVLLTATYAVNVWAAAPGPTDSRKVFWADPRKSYSSYSRWNYRTVVGNSNPDVIYVPEPGWKDPKTGDHVISRTTDPLNSSKKAFKHKIRKDMTYKSGSYLSARAEWSADWGTPTTGKIGVPYWAAYAFYVHSDHPFNGTGGDMVVLELGHPVTSGNNHPSPAFYLYRNGTLNVKVGSNKVLNGGSSTKVWQSVLSRSVAKGVWHYLLIQYKLEWDVARSPYLRIWHAVGSSGSPVQVLNTTKANFYRESATYIPQKFGEYAWDVTTGYNGIWASKPASSSRTLYTKGLYIFRDQAGTPALNQYSLLELLRGI